MSDIVDKIQKLLNQAEHPNTSAAEAETFFAAAQKLMIKYAVDEAAVREARGERREPVVAERWVYATRGWHLGSKNTLLGVVSQAMGVRCVLHPATGKAANYRAKCTLVGFASDIEFVKVLYSSIMLQMLGSLKRDGIRGYGAETGWLAGFAVAIMRKLEAGREEVKADNSMALVLFDRKKEVDAEYEERFPNARSVTPRKVDGRYYWDGKRAGQNADVSGGKNGLRQQPRLGS